MFKKGRVLGFINLGKWCKKIILKDLYVFVIIINESYFSVLFKDLIVNKVK